MELEMIPNTMSEQSGTTGGSGTAGRDAPNFCEGKPVEQSDVSQTTLDFLSGRWPTDGRNASEVYGSVYFDAFDGHIDGAQIMTAMRRAKVIMSSADDDLVPVRRHMGHLKAALEHLLSYGDIVVPQGVSA